MLLKTEKVLLVACLVASPALLLGACSPPELSGHHQVSRASAPIIDGTFERGRKQVVVVSSGGALCTGALVADRVVLSAKHCIQQPGAEGPALPRDVRIGVGSIAGFTDADVKWFSVQSIVTTPGKYSEGVFGVQELSGSDVSILTLTSSVAGVAPLKLKLDDPSDQEGEHATAVGFGQTPDGDIGAKYTVGTTIGRVSDKTIQVDGTVCQGDSGGPLINDRDEVMGVVSYGSSAGCGGGASFYQRIDIWADLIRDAIGMAAECGESGPEACDGFDNDCDSKIDEDCLGVGEQCEADVDCVTRLCAQTEKGKVCTSPCDPMAEKNTCDEGFTCASNSDCKGVCVKGKAGDKAFGEECARDADCASLVCADPGDGVSRCLVVCIGDDGHCLSGEACTGGAKQCGQCSPAEGLVRELGLDEPCKTNSECRSELCFDDGGTSYCATACEADNDCDDRHHCRGGACARGARQGLGGRCSEHEDCERGQFCAKSDAGAFCTRTCSKSNACDDGFTCEQVSNGSVCFPAAGVLAGSCTTDKACGSGKCDEKTGTCTRKCADPNDCGVGLECVRVDNVSGLCLPPDRTAGEPGDDAGPGDGGGSDGDGSCAVSAPGTAPQAAWVSLLSLLAGCVFVVRRKVRG